MRRLSYPLGAPNAFFGREGGVSEGVYSSLNCGFGSDDDPLDVAENRERVRAVMDARALQTCYQVHSARAVLISEVGARPEADGLVTTTPGLALGVLSADCGPVLMADAKAGVVGACHAGWKGAVSGITDATVALMRECGARDIRAVLGPCIRLGSYEVGEAFRERATALDPEAADFFHAREPEGFGEPSWRGAAVHFDLPRYLVARLERLGVEADWSGACTYADQDAGEPCYFSYRRSVHLGEDDYGRNLSAVMLG